MGSSDSMGDDVPREETVCSQGLSNKEHPDVLKAAGLLGHCFFEVASYLHWSHLHCYVVQRFGRHFLDRLERQNKGGGHGSKKWHSPVSTGKSGGIAQMDGCENQLYHKPGSGDSYM